MPNRKKGLHLHQVLLEVKDVDRSREFYTETLGFKLLYDFSPRYLAVLTPNRLQIGFHPPESKASRARSKKRTVGIEFEVDNVDSWYNKLRKLGVRFTQKPKDAWGEREVRFRDPDGYSSRSQAGFPRRGTEKVPVPSRVFHEGSAGFG